MAVVFGTGQGLEVQLEGPFGSVGSAVKIVSVTLPAANWKGGESPYFQTVAVEGITRTSLAALQPDKEQLLWLCSSGTALQLENEEGIVTAFAMGTKPQADLTLQVTLTEVMNT